MNLSLEARAYLDRLTEAYTKRGFPNHKAWQFAKGESGASYDELAAHGLIERMGTKDGFWRLTDKGKDWILTHREPDEIRWARTVFSRFESTYAEKASDGGQWWLSAFDDADATELGLELRQVKVGLRILLQKRLLTADASGEAYLELTELGEDACLHRQVLDDTLAPPRSAASLIVDARTSNVFNGPAQIGDGNVQYVTYSVVLQQLLQQIESDPNIEPEKKSRWGDVVKDIVASGIGNAVVAGLQTILG